MDCLPGWRISSMQGPTPRQHEHERRYTTLTHPFIPTKRIWKDDYDCQMIFGDLVGLKLPAIDLKGVEKPHPGNFSRPEIEPGPDAWQTRMLPPTPQRKFILQNILISGSMFVGLLFLALMNTTSFINIESFKKMCKKLSWKKSLFIEIMQQKITL